MCVLGESSSELSLLGSPTVGFALPKLHGFHPVTSYLSKTGGYSVCPRGHVPAGNSCGRENRVTDETYPIEIESDQGTFRHSISMSHPSQF
jgi:hypothetical protein